MCYDEGILQAYLDDEITKEEKQEIEAHIANCSRCQAVVEQLVESNTFVDLHLTTYKKQLDRLEPVSGKILGEYDSDLKQKEPMKKKKGVFNLLKKYKKLTATAAVIATLGLTLSFAPVRSVAAQFLTLFRVQKVETTAISIDDLNRIQQAFYNKGVELDIENLGKVENEQTGEHKQVSLKEAKETVDFELKTPTYMPENLQFDQYASLQPAVKVNFTLNVKNVNAVMEQLGGKNMIPENLDGRPFTLSIPQSVQVNANYGEGKNHKSINLFQTNSPELKLPDGVNADEVRRAILDLPIIPPDIKQKLAALKDWQDTLYVPQPRNGTTENVTINGSSGVMIKESWGDGRNHNTLMWQKNGIFYTMNGYSIPGEELIKVANSLK